VQFNNHFTIWINREDTITLDEALVIAKKESVSDMIYDPLGLYNEKSWWWVAGVLEVLQQDNFIREFDIVKPAPKDQQIESVEGTIY
jgi:hypothetical protein